VLFFQIETNSDIFNDFCFWVESIEDPNLTLFSLVIWEQSDIADFLFVGNITGEVFKDSRHIDFRVQSFPSWSSGRVNSSIVAPCNELVDTWCRLTFQQTLCWFRLALVKAFSCIDLWRSSTYKLFISTLASFAGFSGLVVTRCAWCYTEELVYERWIFGIISFQGFKEW
jgi:hypothetical protein